MSSDEDEFFLELTNLTKSKKAPCQIYSSSSSEINSSDSDFENEQRKRRSVSLCLTSDIACENDAYEPKTKLKKIGLEQEASTHITAVSDAVPKKRGPRYAVNVEELHAEFNKYSKSIVKNNRIVVPSESQIYKKIASGFKDYSEQAAYQSAKRYFKKRLVNLTSTKKVKFDDYMLTFDRYTLQDHTCNKYTVNIEGLNLFKNENGQIVSMTEWRPKFARIAFAMTRCQCAWSFDRPRMAGNEITINAYCLERRCSAKLFAYTENNQKKLRITVSPDNENVVHEKKNQIRGTERKEINDMLKTDKASVVVAKMANDTLRIGDLEPPFLPNVSTVRKIKRGLYDDLIFHDDPVLSLREMKYAEQYQNTIEDVGLDPFDCLFSTPYQREFFRTQTNRRRFIISLDASEPPVLKPKRSSYSITQGKYKPIFLYVILLKGEGKENLPIYQVLTQRQDAVKVGFSLDSWKYYCLGAKKPDEVIVDNSATLLLASAKSFAGCDTMVIYDNQCYEALHSNDIRPPATYIRRDRNHTVHEFMMMFTNVDRNKKRFYTRIFGVLMLTKSINVAEDIIHKMFIVLMNRFQHNQSIIDAIASLKYTTDTHRVIVDSLIEEAETPAEKIENVEEEEHETQVTIEETSKTKFSEWVMDIVDTVKENYVNEDLNNSTEIAPPNMNENPFYAENLQKQICNELSKIHLWSNIMMDTFGSTNDAPTSACSESEFNVVKNVVFSNEKKLRVDVFVRRYIDNLNGRSIRLLVKTNTAQTREQVMEANSECQLSASFDEYLENEADSSILDWDTDDNDESIVPQENWRNKNLDIKPDKKYHRCKNTILEPYKNTSRLRVFMNTNLWNKIKKKKSTALLIYNSCPFDSIFQLYGAAFLDSAVFKEYVKKHESDFTKLLVDFCDWKDMDELLIARDALLQDIFDEEVVINRKVLELNCFMSVADMFNRLNGKYNLLSSVIEKRSCPACLNTNLKIYGVLPIQTINLNLEHIDRSLRFKDEENACQKCDTGMTLKVQKTFNPVVLIDLDGMQQPNIRINQIQSVLNLYGKEYHLNGLIESRSQHFAAHARRADGLWHTYDDCRPTETKTISDSTVLHPVLISYCIASPTIKIPDDMKSMPINSITMYNSGNSSIKPSTLNETRKKTNVILDDTFSTPIQNTMNNSTTTGDVISGIDSVAIQNSENSDIKIQSKKVIQFSTAEDDTISKPIQNIYSLRKKRKKLNLNSYSYH